MARKVRVEYPGAIYHVMNRGDHQEAIFADDRDRIRFVETLGQACSKAQWQVHAYCLMSNHFHLLVETPLGNLVSGMKWSATQQVKLANLRREAERQTSALPGNRLLELTSTRPRSGPERSSVKRNIA